MAPRLRGLRRCLSTRTRAGHAPDDSRGAFAPPSRCSPGSGCESGSSASNAISEEIETVVVFATAGAGERGESSTTGLLPPLLLLIESQRATERASASAATAAMSCFAFPPAPLLLLALGGALLSSFVAAGVEDVDAVTAKRLLGPGEAPKAGIFFGEVAMF
jgi:hypothetical protein